MHECHNNRIGKHRKLPYATSYAWLRESSVSVTPPVTPLDPRASTSLVVGCVIFPKDLQCFCEIHECNDEKAFEK